MNQQIKEIVSKGFTSSVNRPLRSLERKNGFVILAEKCGPRRKSGVSENIA